MMQRSGVIVSAKPAPWFCRVPAAERSSFNITPPRLGNIVWHDSPRALALTWLPQFPISPRNLPRCRSIPRVPGPYHAQRQNKRNRARRGLGHETHFPAEQARAHPPPRFPRPDGHQERPQDPEPASRCRSQEALRLGRGRATAMPECNAAVRRLTKRRQFLRAARGNRAGRPAFQLQVVEAGDDEPGLGLTVTKRVGNAPERNRIRRRLREAARACEAAFRPQHDYVLVGRRDALSVPFDKLVGELASAVSKVHAQSKPAGLTARLPDER